MPSIKIKETESFDVGLRKFRRACERAGVITEVRKRHFDIGLRKFKRACEKAAIVPEIRAREFYEKPTEERKRKAAAAVKRNYKRVMKDSFAKLK